MVSRRHDEYRSQRDLCIAFRCRCATAELVALTQSGVGRSSIAIVTEWIRSRWSHDGSDSVEWSMNAFAPGGMFQ